MTMRSTIRQAMVAMSLATAALLASAGPLAQNYSAGNVEGHATSGLYDAQNLYLVGLVPWEANLLPPRPIYASTFALTFFDVLVAAFPQAGGRTFSSSLNELTGGSLVIRTYDVVGQSDRVGAALHVEYKPGAGDPTDNIHWIQVIRTNHKIGEAHGTEEWKVDNLGAATPYYDTSAAANSRNFYDLPWRSDGDAKHIWIGQLMLVSGPADGVGAITFLGGLTWGWENHAFRDSVATFSTPLGIDLTVAGVPEAQTWLMLALGLLFVARSVRARALDSRA